MGFIKSKAERLTGVILATALSVVWGNMIYDESLAPAPSPLPPRIAAGQDDRITLSTLPGAPHESIGIVATGGGSCTNIYQGKNSILSAAHCFENVASAPPGAYFTGFHVESKKDGGMSFTTGGFIMEIAIPENYIPAKNEIYNPQSAGYDVAFVRIVPLIDGSLPKESFPPRSTIDSTKVFQAGYNADKPGLTGDFNCTILPQDKWQTPYTISTDCAAVTGSSGGPVLDEHNNLIGIAETVEIDPSSGVVHKTNFTPITPGIKEAFEQFKNGTLKGKTEILPSGIRLIKFPYERVPAKIPAIPVS